MESTNTRHVYTVTRAASSADRGVTAPRGVRLGERLTRGAMRSGSGGAQLPPPPSRAPCLPVWPAEASVACGNLGAALYTAEIIVVSCN